MSQKYSQDEAQALVKALKEGNQLAFSIVYKTYAAQTFSLAFKYLLNKELAEQGHKRIDRVLPVGIGRIKHIGGFCMGFLLAGFITDKELAFTVFPEKLVQ